jgi:hypothetical protein
MGYLCIKVGFLIGYSRLYFYLNWYDYRSLTSIYQ